MSLSIITSLRFQRSTSAPATGLSRTVGPKVKKPTSASAVAWPVSCHAQMVSAKPDMAVPKRENTCPAHTTIKARMPVD